MLNLIAGQSVYLKRSRIGTLSIRRIPATVLKVAGERIQIELGETVSGLSSSPWVNRSSLELRSEQLIGDKT